MRILWVKVGGLWPLTTGGRLRSFHTIRELSRQHAVTVLTTHGPDEDPGETRANLPDCERLDSVRHAPPKRGGAGFGRAVVRSWLSPLPVDLRKWRVPALRDGVSTSLAAEPFDLCVADFLSATPNLPAPYPVPVALFEHNVEHMIWRRLAHTVPAWQRPPVELEWRKVRRAEARAVARATLTIAVSEDDRARLASVAPGAPVRSVATGVDTEYFTASREPEGSPHLAFVGTMDWYPNEDAVAHFLDAVWPEIRREVPEATFAIVGRNPSERLRSEAARAGVEVTGTVDDVRPHLARAAVVVVPLRVGGGTRLKILEALAMAKPVVSTTIGAEGLPLTPGTHFLQADAPSDFAAAVVGLLRDAPRRRELGEAGRRLVEERHGWPGVAREFEARCAEAISLG